MTSIYGESPEYLDIKQWTVEDGDMFTEEDIRKSAKVCLIGKTVADELFPNGGDPVGKDPSASSPFRSG